MLWMVPCNCMSDKALPWGREWYFSFGFARNRHLDIHWLWSPKGWWERALSPWLILAASPFPWARMKLKHRLRYWITLKVKVLCCFFTEYRWFPKIFFTWLASDIANFWYCQYLCQYLSEVWKLLCYPHHQLLLSHGQTPSFTSFTISSIMSLSMPFAQLILQSCGGGVELVYRLHMWQDLDLVEVDYLSW